MKTTKLISLRQSIIILAILSIFEIFAGSNEPVLGVLRHTSAEPFLWSLHNGNSIVFNISIGYAVSFIFWMLVVYLPERNKIRIIKNNLTHQYLDFKEEVIGILLSASVGSYHLDLRKKLCDHEEFKNFFGGNSNEKWYAALNGLQSNPERIRDILVELEILSDGVSYALNRIDVSEQKVHSFFKLLLSNIYRLRNSSTFSDDQVKYVGNFLWGIFARWSFIDGQRADDEIQEMIDRM